MYRKNLIKTTALALLIATAGCGKEEVISTLDTVQEVVETVEEKEAVVSVEEVPEVKLPEINVEPEVKVEEEPEIEPEAEPEPEIKLASNGLPPIELPDKGDANYDKVEEISRLQNKTPEEIKAMDPFMFLGLSESIPSEYKDSFTEEQYKAIEDMWIARQKAEEAMFKDFVNENVKPNQPSNGGGAMPTGEKDGPAPIGSHVDISGPQSREGNIQG